MKYLYAASVLAIFASAALIPSCGGTSVGNPQVRLESVPYGNGTAFIPRFLEWLTVPSAFATPVTELKFCVTKIEMENESGNNVGGDEDGEIEAELGLIDVSNQAATVDWGSLTVPFGFTMSEIDIEIHHDAEKCAGANYSMRYNGADVTKDLELQFRFNPPVTVNVGDVYKLDLTNIATAIEQAAAAGKFTNQDIDSYLTANTKGEGSE